MKCLSCEIKVNAKWSHAINSNICPACGGKLLDEDLQYHLANLNEALRVCQEKAEGFEDWILENYNLVSTTSERLKEFLPKPAPNSLPRGPIPAEGQLIEGGEPLNPSPFMERAGLSPEDIEKHKQLKQKAMINKITGSGGVIMEEDVDMGDEVDFEDSPDLEPPPAVLAMGGGSSGTNHKDLMLLRQLQEKSRGAKKRMGDGGFSRG